MEIFDGKKEAEKILIDLKKRIKREKLSPSLAVVLVGKNPESLLYIKNKKKAAEKVGIKIVLCEFRKNVGEERIIKKIKKLNDDQSINGIIVQLPLPQGLNTSKIINSIDPKKDVDGFCEKNRAMLKKNKPYFFPVLPSAIFTIIKSLPFEIKEKRIIALVNSDIFGKTLKTFFDKKGVKIKYLLGKNKIFLPLKRADIIISACGRPYFIKGEMVKKGVALIDAGIRIVKGKVVGDVDRKSLDNKASFLTPVPGGVGPLTVALLLKNVYLGAKAQKKKYGFGNR